MKKSSQAMFFFTLVLYLLHLKYAFISYHVNSYNLYNLPSIVNDYPRSDIAA